MADRLTPERKPPRRGSARGWLMVLPRRRRLGHLAALAVMALMLAAAATGRLGQPVFLPHKPPAVAGEVVLERAAIPFGGLTEDEARLRLERLAVHVEREPRDAYLDPATRTAVPATDGLALDVAATLESLLAADAGSQVRAVYAWHQAGAGLAAVSEAPILRGPPERRAVSLAINVAWGGEFLDHLQEVLAILRDEDVQVTFFVVGEWASAHPVQARELAARGHELAAHGHRDIDLTGRASSQVQQEVTASQDVLRDVAGVEIRWFSPPYGAWDPTVLAATEAAGLRLVLWSIDTVDWRRPGVAWMRAKVERDLHPGAIILTHPTEQVPALLRQLIPSLKARGYAIVPVGQLLNPAWEPDLAAVWAQLEGDS